MDNFQMPGAQPMQPVQPTQPAQVMPPVIQTTPTVYPVQKKDNSKTIMVAVAAVLGILVILFGFLFLKKSSDYDELTADFDNQLEAAVNESLDEKLSVLEQEFADRDKHPFEKFTGPEDYGQLSFEYPRTWSVYIASDTSGRDYEAYLNPGQVNAISNNEIYALRLKIVNQQFEDYIDRFSSKESDLSVRTIIVNGNVTANYYSGTIPGTELKGFIVIFKIRDKTVVLETDSVLFENDFNSLVDSITFSA